MIKNYEDQLIVITGAAGFIGSCLVRYLNDKGFSNLLLVDDFKKSEKWKNLLKKQCVDFISKNDLFSWLQGKESEIKAFIHLGACSDTLETDGSYLMENNYRYTLRLAEYALTHGQRFIYASSAATYGDGSRGFSDDHAVLEELQPLNLYGFSKHFFDLWAKKQGVLDQIVGLKYFNVFGPNENHKGRMASMVYKMLPAAEQEGVIRLFKSSEPSRFGDGDQCRDFIYVKDAVEMTCSFLENDAGGIFNIGRGEVSTWNALARALFTALQKPACIEYIDMPAELVKQYQNYTCADMSKYIHYERSQTWDFCTQPNNPTPVLDSACGIQVMRAPICKYTLEEAVIDYVQNYLLKDQRW